MKTRLVKNNKGQAALEVSVLVIVLAAALLAMTVYIKRAVQGRIKQSADEIADQYSTTASDSYTSIETVSTVTSDVQVENEGTLDARSVSTVNTDETTIRRVNEQIQGPDKEKLF